MSYQLIEASGGAGSGVEQALHPVPGKNQDKRALHPREAVEGKKYESPAKFNAEWKNKRKELELCVRQRLAQVKHPQDV